MRKRKYHINGKVCTTDGKAGNVCDSYVGEDTQTFPTLSQALEQGLTLTADRAIKATNNEVRAAVLVLAAGAREVWPKAERVTLSSSGEGDWLMVDAIDGSTSLVDGTFDETYGHAAQHLYLPNLAASPFIHAFGYDLHSASGYYIDITEALG